jgi:hypothetical protein
VSELRGQAADAGYTRFGGWFSSSDRLADTGAENAIKEALAEFLESMNKLEKR